MVDYDLPGMPGNKSHVHNILIVRLGAMGDIIHALPAAAALRQSFPNSHFTWVVDAKWTALLEGNGLQDRIVPFHRRDPSTWMETRRELRSRPYDLAVDFQGLIKSSLVAHFARPERIIGYGPRVARERPASWFYSTRVNTKAVHVVDQAMELAVAAGAQKTTVCAFPMPGGKPEGVLPEEPFVLTCPVAGWTSKQWPLESYAALAQSTRTKLGMPMVINGAPGSLPVIEGAVRHESGIGGLIHATRRAALVMGVDSGPLHLAAALGKSGVAIFGPTDPARNGPRGGNFQVFRAEGVTTTHRRGDTISESMRAITPEQVLTALASRVGCHA